MRDFGGRGERLRGRSWRKRGWVKLMNPTPGPSANQQAAEVKATGELPAVVAYQTPRKRAGDALRRSAISGAVSLAVVCLGIVLAFLQAGNFTRAALVAAGIALVSNAIQAAMSWLLKLQAASADDADPVDVR